MFISVYYRTFSLRYSAGILILCLALDAFTQKACSETDSAHQITLEQARTAEQTLAYTSRFLRINDYLFNGINKLTAIA